LRVMRPLLDIVWVLRKFVLLIAVAVRLPLPFCTFFRDQRVVRDALTKYSIAIRT